MKAKRVWSAVLCAGLALSMCVNAGAAAQNDELRAAASYVSEQGVMVGDQNGDMALDQTLSRTELAVILTRITVNPEHLEAERELYTRKCEFPDVPEWARLYVGYLSFYFEAQGCSGEVTGSFTAFGLPEGAMSRASLAIKFTLAFVKVDNTVQKIEVDITDVIVNSESGEGGGNDEPSKDIELPLDDDEVKVDKPENSSGGDGGIGGDVGDWGEEEEVPLPVI